MSEINRIQRVNFVEREPFGLTYRKMILVGGVIVGLVVMMIGAQWVRGRLAGQEAARLEDEVKKLRAERERIFKETGSSGADSTDAREVLINLIDSAPPWSMILRELAARTPRSVWLTNLKSIPRAASNAAQVSQGIELSGHADDAGRVAQFVRALQQAPLFSDVVLTSSKKGKDVSVSAYEFVINLSVQSARGKGL